MNNPMDNPNFWNDPVEIIALYFERLKERLISDQLNWKDRVIFSIILPMITSIFVAGIMAQIIN